MVMTDHFLNENAICIDVFILVFIFELCMHWLSCVFVRRGTSKIFSNVTYLLFSVEYFF